MSVTVHSSEEGFMGEEPCFIYECTYNDKEVLIITKEKWDYTLRVLANGGVPRFFNENGMPIMVLDREKIIQVGRPGHV